MIKKSIAVLLILCISMGLLVACSGGDSKLGDEQSADTSKGADIDDSSKDKTNSDQENGETSETDDPFPGADLGGVTLKISGIQNPETADEASKEKWAERQKEVEEKFNCKLVFDPLDGIEWNEVPERIASSLAAGDPLLDFGDLSRYYLSELMNNDAILDLTKEVEAFNFPKAYYEGGAQWKDKTVGFGIGPYFPFQIIAYNRDLIKAAGMGKTPSEMFKEGKWSFDDFYDYLEELNTKLPEGVNTFGMHALFWARFAAFANGASMMDEKTYVPTYTSDAFYEGIELFQKLVKNGIAVNAKEVTRDDGTTGYDWNEAGNGFVEGELAMTIAHSWDFENIAANIDYGVVPAPWGSNVTIKDNDYRTLSDNYNNYLKDCGVWAIIKGAEKKATPEQYMNLLYSYNKEAGETLLEDREKEAKGEPITPSDAGQPRNFTTDLDIELWDWYISRCKFDPVDTTAVSNVFFRALYKACATNENPRSAFEAVVGQDVAALVDAKLVDVEDLSDDLKKQMDAYLETAEE